MEIINTFNAVEVTLKSHNYSGRCVIPADNVDEVIGMVTRRAEEASLPVEFGENRLTVGGDLIITLAPALDTSYDTVNDAFDITFE